MAGAGFAFDFTDGYTVNGHFSGRIRGEYILEKNEGADKLFVEKSFIPNSLECSYGRL